MRANEISKSILPTPFLEQHRNIQQNQPFKQKRADQKTLLCEAQLSPYLFSANAEFRPISRIIFTKSSKVVKRGLFFFGYFFAIYLWESRVSQ